MDQKLEMPTGNDRHPTETTNTRFKPYDPCIPKLTGLVTFTTFGNLRVTYPKPSLKLTNFVVENRETTGSLEIPNLETTIFRGELLVLGSVTIPKRLPADLPAFVFIFFLENLRKITLPETNVAPENGWLDY